MRLKCRGCGVILSLKDRGAKPGAMIRVNCPKCGQRHTSAIPGHTETDEAFRKVREAMDFLEKIAADAEVR